MRRRENGPKRRLFPKSLPHGAYGEAPAGRRLPALLAPAGASERRRYCTGAGGSGGAGQGEIEKRREANGMCLAVPGKILNISGEDFARTARVRFGGSVKRGRLACGPDA